jgi:PIN domain nuclease of toxin-antitoxin system
MRLLLDTHTFLWFSREPEKLPDNLRSTIIEAGPEAGVSVASIWEIAIKVSMKKLTLPAPFETLFPTSVSAAGLTLLPIEVQHLTMVSQLPWHHKDPFDRLLIAQARVGSLTVATCDPFFQAYGVKTIW